MYNIMQQTVSKISRDYFTGICTARNKLSVYIHIYIEWKFITQIDELIAKRRKWNCEREKSFIKYSLYDFIEIKRTALVSATKSTRCVDWEVTSPETPIPNPQEIRSRNSCWLFNFSTRGPKALFCVLVGESGSISAITAIHIEIRSRRS